MTSNVPAEPRPPSLRHPPDSLRPSLNRSMSNVLSPIDRKPPPLQTHVGESGEDRPAKRRKVEGDTSANQASGSNTGPRTSTTPNAPQVNKTPHLRLVKPSALFRRLPKPPDKNEEGKWSQDEAPDLPARPWRLLQHSKSTDDSKPTHRSRVNLPVPNTPDSLEVPTSAPQFVSKKPAGFFPWTGKHPEDILSDINVKQGYFDKPPNPTEKELNTARVPLYNALKHKSGVDNLSILFSLVLDQKNRHGLISSVSTFKPPPRVTLTEAKRKSWISDLANADVPLRRLSRTIPQGIRGQILLDQCLQSSVPLSRAIWFAKCVCANEIRTLKRKGTTPAVAVGTESKWLREWTDNVEQFVETYLGQSNNPEWRSNIQYALRLTTRLYLENLLDRDHYLDWIVRSLTSADPDQTPFWLMVIHIYKQDLSHYRRRGRKLAEALIGKYQLLAKSTDQMMAPLRLRLHQAIRSLLLYRPVTFLMPDRWPDIVPVVQSCLDTSSPQEHQILDRLNHINGRTMGFNKQEFSAKRAPDQAIVDILDAARVPFNLEVLTDSLASAYPDIPRLIFSCLEWACTRFRQSRTRIYLFTRLIKRWQRYGHDVDTVILNYLSACREKRTTVDIDCLKHLAAHLSRSNCFPLSKYLQWLMVRGLPKRGSVGIDLDSLTGTGRVNQHQGNSDPSQLLLDLSLQNVEDHVLNLRNSLLRRSGLDPQVEESLFRRCVQYLEEKLAKSRSSSRSQEQTSPEPHFVSLPWTVRSKISMWLRSRVAEAAALSMSGTLTTPAPLGSNLFSVEQFSFIRHILECLEDEAVLADVVGILCGAQDDDLAAALVSTIHFHADTFSAMGALDVLQKRVCQTYLSWRSTKPTMPLLTTTLLDLCTSFPVKAPTIKLLQQDLVRGDRGRAVAACSPYSDGIAESLQQAGATFVEDFEAILQSEPNMNEQTMNGLFTVLAERIEKQQHFGDDSQTILSFCQLLSRLRLCRKTQADLLIQQWVSRLSPFLDGDFGASLFQALIGTGCMTCAGLFEAVRTSKSGLRQCKAITSMLRHILALDRESKTDPVLYQVRTKWLEHSRREPRIALEVLCEAGLATQLEPFGRRLLSFLVNDSTLSSSSMSDRAEEWSMKALDRLLHCEGGIRGDNLRPLLGSINIFSHRYVQLRFWLASRLGVEKASAEDQDQLVEVLGETLEQMIHETGRGHRGDGRFSQLLQAVGYEVANRLRHKVENEFLEALPKFPPSKVTSPLTAVFPSDVHQLSSIVERAFWVCSSSTTPLPGLLSHLIDKLSQHVKSLGNPPPAATSTPTCTAIPGLSTPATNMFPAQMMSVTSSPIVNTSENVSGPFHGVMLDYLQYMLQMVCLQRPGLISVGGDGPSLKKVQSEQVQLLVRLAMIATHPAIASASNSSTSKEEQQKAKRAIDFTLDVIATIVDEVSEEVRMMSAKMLKDKMQDVRLKYLFGSVNMMGSVQVHDMGEGLQMVKEGKGVVGDWKPRVWEVLDNGSGKENETSLGLGLFGARRG
ncbi:uncharacterized protein Z518_08216 [Rhinocladiella mackenziei CBS 650.93]|uniref:Mediator of RNA polymerase II transcription subunit 12 n=1 Tax=Rhinocladiella mackenziei CBS 650.93 TaxID=1442369 RepID=A0A0D2FJX4_9EURO|nr:uncharacterized protein Z518_08216 [Rhinocladiella mackenziei CBS 650.93]KIX02277.1 hypothetical protein Z518_08216 [Rhinocladiella mackenziei CBS 650.93]